MAMIIRRTGCDRVARLLSRKSEDPEDSALEFLDQRMEVGGYLGETIREIEDDTIDKGLTKSKSKGFFKSTEEPMIEHAHVHVATPFERDNV